MEFDIGQRIKQLRESRGWTQEKLAKELKSNRVNVAKLETGKKDLKSLDIINLSRLFNVSTDYLLGLSPLPNREGEEKRVCDYIHLSKETVAYLHKKKNRGIYSILETCISNIFGILDNISVLSQKMLINRLISTACKNKRKFEIRTDKAGRPMYDDANDEFWEYRQNIMQKLGLSQQKEFQDIEIGKALLLMNTEELLNDYYSNVVYKPDFIAPYTKVIKKLIDLSDKAALDENDMKELDKAKDRLRNIYLDNTTIEEDN